MIPEFRATTARRLSVEGEFRPELHREHGGQARLSTGLLIGRVLPVAVGRGHECIAVAERCGNVGVGHILDLYLESLRVVVTRASAAPLARDLHDPESQ